MKINQVVGSWSAILLSLDMKILLTHSQSYLTHKERDLSVDQIDLYEKSKRLHPFLFEVKFNMRTFFKIYANLLSHENNLNESISKIN